MFAPSMENYMDTDVMLNTPPRNVSPPSRNVSPTPSRLSLKNNKTKKKNQKQKKLTFESGQVAASLQPSISLPETPSAAPGESQPVFPELSGDLSDLIGFNLETTCPINAGGCTHAPSTILTNAQCSMALGIWSKLTDMMDNTRSSKKDPNGGPCVNSHQMLFKSSLNPTPGAKTANMNIVMKKSMKEIRMMFCNNADTPNAPFFLNPIAAELIIGEAYNIMNGEFRDRKEYKYRDDDCSYLMRVSETEFVIEKTHLGSIQSFKLTFQDMNMFKAELYATLVVLRTYPNVERMRNRMLEFIQTEFRNCKCAHMTSSMALKIILTHYYKIGEALYDPLPPHHITIGDIINEAFTKF